MLLGSGTEVVVPVVVLVVLLLVPRIVNDSEGIDPTEFSSIIHLTQIRPLITLASVTEKAACLMGMLLIMLAISIYAEKRR